MTAPAFHNMTTAIAILRRVIAAAGNEPDTSSLSADELYFLAALPRSEDDKAFATSRIRPSDQAQLAALYDRCSALAGIPSAIGKSAEGGARSTHPTSDATRVFLHG